ncbi:hypothetical protein Pla175_46040 [Pirellulimonas nuda]|uniref:Uncharacterized protein n=1 Tax=Pirellulimonas nuda TaxID=2528009 RepID=A0A518DI89_9BACT|nr:hypothetical protein [Pirellulimonas nuda]QDU91184.1 hypothetical protein Pla175_46040 [Pirellulimonas nuda]
MRNQTLSPAVLAAILLAIGGPWIVVGCADSARQAEIASAREKYLLTSKPTDAIPVLAVRDQDLEASEEGVDVVFTGKIGGMPNPWPEREKAFPWRTEQAVVFVVDPATAAEFADHQHAPGSAGCAFCERRAMGMATSVATVSFGADTAHGPTPIDVRTLFDLREGDTVVVRGKAKRVGDADTGLIDVVADGIYVEPRS